MSSVNTNFSDISIASLPLDAGDAARFNWLTATHSLNFVVGVDQAVELAISASGVSFLSYYVQPHSNHQSIECVFRRNGAAGTASQFGVFGRFLNSTNHVVLLFDRTADNVQLIETVAGTPTTLGTFDPPGSANGGGIRLEIVGRAARVWVGSFYGIVEDRPPDAILTLATEPTIPGDWGIYKSSSGTSSGMRFTRFLCRDIVNASMAPPSLIAENRQVEDLVAVTLTASDLDAGARYLQWQIAPFDPDDFAEVSEWQTPVDITSCVAHVRPGYDYEFRVRSIDDFGVPGDWIKERFVPTGSKTAPANPAFPADDFPSIDPDVVLVREQDMKASRFESNNERESFETAQSRPRNRFTLKYEFRPLEDIQAILDFFDLMGGRDGSFVWTHPISGKQYAARFDSDEISPSVQDVKGEDDLGLHGLEVPIVEISYDVTGSITASFAVDTEFTEIE